MSSDAIVDPVVVRDLRSLLSGDDWPLRWQRKLGLVPSNGMGLVRRAVFYTLLACAPLAVWAFVNGRALPGAGGEPLFAHFGVIVRCLVAIPLLILAEGMALRATVGMATQFVRSGIVTEAQHGRFATLLRDVARLRDSSVPWVIVFGVVATWILANPADPGADGLSWAVVEPGHVGLGGWWFAYVARPIYLVLLLGWLLRIVLAFIMFRRIAKLDLALVPTHPDRVGGLGFLESYPGAFALVTFAVSAVFASSWAHDIVYHGHHVESLVHPLVAFAVVWTLLLLAPLLVFAPRLLATKRQAKLDYGRLVGEQGRLVRQRWILGEPLADDALVDAPGIGPVADAATMYESVRRMRAAPIGKAALMAVAIPLLLPMLAVFALEIPLKTILMNLVKALV